MVVVIVSCTLASQVSELQGTLLSSVLILQMRRLRLMVREMVTDPGLELMSLESPFKTFNTTLCYFVSHSNSSFTRKTPLSTSFHLVLFCPSLLSTLAKPSYFLASYPYYMFSGF